MLSLSPHPLRRHNMVQTEQSARRSVRPETEDGMPAHHCPAQRMPGSEKSFVRRKGFKLCAEITPVSGSSLFSFCCVPAAASATAETAAATTAAARTTAATTAAAESKRPMRGPHRGPFIMNAAIPRQQEEFRLFHRRSNMYARYASFFPHSEDFNQPFPRSETPITFSMNFGSAIWRLMRFGSCKRR